jgi:hypothetical protein
MALHQRTFDLGGCQFQLRSNDSRLLTIIASEFREDFNWRANKPTLELELNIKSDQFIQPLFSHEVLPLKKNHFQLARERQVSGWILQDLLHLEDGEHFLDLDYSNCCGRGYFSEQIFSQPKLLTHTYFLVAVIELLRTQGVYYLHGGCVMSPDKKVAALLLGDGGVGKSTSCCLLSTLGWSLLADDALLLTLGGNGPVRVYPLLQRLLVDPTLAHRFPGMMFTGIEETAKGRVNFKSIGLTTTHDGVVPTHAFVMRPCHQELVSSLQPISKSSLIAELIGQNVFLFFHPSLAEHHLTVLTSLAKQCSASQLMLAADLLEDPRRLDSLLRRGEITPHQPVVTF